MSQTLILASEVPPTAWGIAAFLASGFLGGGGWLGRWLFTRLDRADTEKRELYDKLLYDVMPALKSSTEVVQKVLERLGKMDEDHSDLVEKMNQVVSMQSELSDKQEALHRQELAFARRRGGA